MSAMSLQKEQLYLDTIPSVRIEKLENEFNLLFSVNIFLVLKVFPGARRDISVPIDQNICLLINY